MTIRIMNTCNQFCLHCMQQSGPNEKDIMVKLTEEKS